MKIQTSPNFNFWRTVYSHGWCALPPFEVVKEEHRLRMVAHLPDSVARIIEIEQPGDSNLNIVFPHDNPTSAEKKKLSSIVRTCLRLDEDYSEFYTEAKKDPAFRWVAKFGAGRLLRAPTVFEDVVKMICTTNCSWSLTEVMVGNLCGKLGQRLNETKFAFPMPEAIAETSEKFLRQHIRAGYRAPYLLEFARRIVKSEIDPEQWRSSNLPTEELFDEVRSVKGVGPYAAGNILKLLGRYDYLAIDSWCRKKFAEIHRNGRKVTDKIIERHYEPFDKWRGLFFWMDVTKHWYNHKIPF